jgi:hypothetical protein
MLLQARAKLEKEPLPLVCRQAGQFLTPYPNEPRRIDEFAIPELG